jgi:competence protein ComEC
VRFSLPASLLGAIVALAACAEAVASSPTAPTPDGAPDPSASSSGAPPAGTIPPSHPTGPPCTVDTPLTVRFYDAGQALSALLILPDGRHLLVDAGESPTRVCSGCKAWHQHVIDGLRRDLGAKTLDALWITHQHSDHVGGAADVLSSFKTAVYVDNGLDLDKTAVVRDARTAVATSGAALHVVDPAHAESPIQGTPPLKLTAIAPTRWPSSCPGDPNACSIALRVDYCKSSILFTGDATTDEENAWDTQGQVTLLQVAHHGSETSTGTAFLQQAKPSYAVISAGKPGEGTNAGFCHPRSVVVDNLTAAMGGAGAQTIRAFDGTTSCSGGTGPGWIDVPASDHLWLTARDGDVTLTTIGDGTFTRQ